MKPMSEKETKSTLSFNVNLSEEDKRRIDEALKTVLKLDEETTKGPVYHPEWKWRHVTLE
jgi:hypothetical protein